MIAVNRPAHPYSDAQLNRLRLSADPLTDAVALRIDQMPADSLLKEVIFLAKSEIGIYQEWLDHLHTVPAWIDHAQLERARQLQLSFANERRLAWAINGLLRTRTRFRCHLINPGQRLNEFLQLQNCLYQPATLLPGGPGHSQLMEQRLNRAMERWALRGHGRNLLTLGEPFNQETLALEMLETGLLTVQGMAALGVTLQADDQLALHHFNRYVAWLSGVDGRLLAETPDQALQLLQRLQQRYGCAPRAEQAELLQMLAEQRTLPLPASLLPAAACHCLGYARVDPTAPLPQRALHLYCTANRGKTFAFYHVPGVAPLTARLNLRKPLPKRNPPALQALPAPRNSSARHNR